MRPMTHPSAMAPRAKMADSLALQSSSWRRCCTMGVTMGNISSWKTVDSTSKPAALHLRMFQRETSSVSSSASSSPCPAVLGVHDLTHTSDRQPCMCSCHAWCRQHSQPPYVDEYQLATQAHDDLHCSGIHVYNTSTAKLLTEPTPMQPGHTA